MSSEKPKITSELAERWAREIYKITATAHPLPGYTDCNFLLTGSDGVRRVFKITAGDAGRSAIEGQLELLRHLDGSEIRALVPRIICDRDGQSLSEARDPNNGLPYFLRTVSYLDGLPLAKFGAATPDLRREIGWTLGRLDSVLMTFDHPGSHRELVWDLARLLELCPLIELLDPDVKPYVDAGLRGFSRKVQPRLRELRTSVIHNDANDHNLLVRQEADGRARLSGLIDFGDAVQTITVAELAIACAYIMLDTEDPHGAAADVVTGYEACLPLLTLERSLLPQLIVGRLCASLLMSAKARLESPDNEYLSISERPVAALLKRLS